MHPHGVGYQPFFNVEILRHVGDQADCWRGAAVGGAIPLGGGNQVGKAELGRPADASRLTGARLRVHAEPKGGWMLGWLHGSQRGRKHGHLPSIGSVQAKKSELKTVGAMNDVNADDARHASTVRRVDE